MNPTRNVRPTVPALPLTVLCILFGVSCVSILAETKAGPRRAAAPASRPAGLDAKNLFKNGDFERGRDPWFDLQEAKKPYWHGFELTDSVAFHGTHSAHLSLESPATADKVAIHGVVQEVAPPERKDVKNGTTRREFPGTISGNVRIENWTRRLPKEYLQFVVILWGKGLRDSNGSEVPNIQIRYILAGVTTPPFQISNGHFIFLRGAEPDGGAEPETGRWIHFERDLRKDWLEQWGFVPEHFEKIRCLFEVRFDDRAEAVPGHLADVYFDDLYIGPALSTAR